MRESAGWSFFGSEFVANIDGLLDRPALTPGGFCSGRGDDQGSPVVMRIFEEYATGTHSTLSLARKLNAEGLNPPGWKSGFRSDSLAQLLRHPAYVGRAKSDQTIRGSWEPIITEEVWHRVQTILNNSKGGSGHGPKYRTSAFRQLLVCADCGQHLYAATMESGVYYRCRQLGTLGGCGTSVKEDHLLPFGRSLMVWLEKASSKARAVAEAVKDGLRDQPHRSVDAVATVERQIERLKWRFDNGYATEEEFAEKMAFLRSQREEIGQPVPVKMPITGLVQAWDTGDNVTRLALLQNMFTGLIIREGEIMDYEPRPEVAEELGRLFEGYSGFGDGRVQVSSLA